MTKTELHSFLEENYERFNRSDFIGPDPISVPHRFSKKQDIEIAGFLAATIALILAGVVNLGLIPVVGLTLRAILSNIVVFVVPAAVIVSLRAVWVLAKQR